MSGHKSAIPLGSRHGRSPEVDRGAYLRPEEGGPIGPRPRHRRTCLRGAPGSCGGEAHHMDIHSSPGRSGRSSEQALRGYSSRSLASRVGQRHVQERESVVARFCRQPEPTATKKGQPVSVKACEQPAPFERADVTPYLEPHHLRRLSDAGPDHPRWVAVQGRGSRCSTCRAANAEYAASFGRGRGACGGEVERGHTYAMVATEPRRAGAGADLCGRRAQSTSSASTRLSCGRSLAAATRGVSGGTCLKNRRRSTMEDRSLVPFITGADRGSFAVEGSSTSCRRTE
jgi:hypothetical protein